MNEIDAVIERYLNSFTVDRIEVGQGVLIDHVIARDRRTVKVGAPQTVLWHREDA